MKRLDSLTPCRWLILPAIFILGCQEAPSADANKAAAPDRKPAALVTLRGEEFDQRVLKSDRPVVVDFFSPSCAICKSVEPVLADVAAEFRSQIDVFKVDVFQDNALAEKYEVDLPPVFLIFRHGKIVAQLGGPISKEDLLAKIEPLLEG